MNILIIWGTDTKTTDLFGKLAGIAIPAEANVTIVAFVNDVSRAAWGDISAPALVADIDAAAKATLPEGTSCKTEMVAEDDMTPWVLDAVATRGFDLVIKTGRRSEGLLHTPSDWKLMRALSVPFYIASPTKLKSKPLILAAIDTDGSDSKHAMTLKVLETAARIAKNRSYELEVVYVIPVNRALKEIDAVDPETVLYNKGPAAQEALDALLAGAGITPAASHVLAGPPGNVIARLARKRKADLVVMGSNGRSGLSAVLLGNTAEKAVHEIKTDVMVVKT
ncbi:universal stress protein [Kordiimonas sp.]|uniref:universal stress protein n=1 Tax=Kordiimonas sp. TaxID=1970157 RepID=UPI003A94C7D2